ncbi:hypothetical protein AMAG_11212 [Allomyces macrogynus ATCC 38327]|uniref:Uncharacterized protein n=1 Tax=Allomyces macrogynus (strain ATCC 38327) TaxID=578462 RepID=A0A0L0SVU4_ALLM3|nr:hypothetical protein AMAG_11212 [Allomyces macrogynus ATCC 38327]|eukprot:KNE66713.1 hypothetical protein AMAG_11212 [Allomyces macrogynus ATCC 38327]
MVGIAVVFVTIGDVQLAPPLPAAQYFVKAQLAHLALRTDVCATPTTRPTFKAPHLHFRVPASDAPWSITLQLFAVTLTGPTLVAATAPTPTSTLTAENGPASQLLAPASKELVGSIHAVCRVFDGANQGAALAPPLPDSSSLLASSWSPSRTAVGDETTLPPLVADEAWSSPGLCGKRLIVTVVKIRAHALKGQAVFVSLHQKQVVKAKSDPILLPSTSASSDDAFPVSATLSTMADASYQGSPTFPSHHQHAVTLVQDTIELSLLLSCIDASVTAPDHLIARHYSLAPMICYELHLLACTNPVAPLRPGSKVMARATAHVTEDAWIETMLDRSRTATSMPPFPRHAFDSAGTCHAWHAVWPAPNSHAQWFRPVGATAAHRVAWNAVTVLPVSVETIPAPCRGVGVELFVVDGVDYALFAYAFLDPDLDRARLFVVSPHAAKTRLYLSYSVKVHGAVAIDGNALTGDDVGAGALEPASSGDMYEDFQALARSIMDMRLEKQQLEANCSAFERRMEEYRGRGGTIANLQAMEKEELLAAYTKLQAIVDELTAQLQSSTSKTSALQTEIVSSTAKLADVQELQAIVQKQNAQLKEFDLVKKKADRLKSIVHQQEMLIQKLETMVAVGPPTGGPTPLAARSPNDTTHLTSVAASILSTDPTQRATLAEARVVALEQQLNDIRNLVAGHKG